MDHISTAKFKKRFISLILGSRNLPKDRFSQHILFISSILRFNPDRTYSENEINHELKKWTGRFGVNFGLDHITLRRYIVDDKYLQRDPSGVHYQLNSSDLPYTYDPDIKAIDLKVLIQDAIKERECRKQQYLRKSKEA